MECYEVIRAIENRFFNDSRWIRVVEQVFRECSGTVASFLRFEE